MNANSLDKQNKGEGLQQVENRRWKGSLSPYKIERESIMTFRPMQNVRPKKFQFLEKVQNRNFG